ncbi:uncharacterized protein FIBRA_02243 [Fibroporia radiculosa]|uniref:C2H2-type domain-containing protein n=1 Tax=Fibroporia radiculosa TaxID=599839 RepID=J4GMP6_9APHY|nr:uncharacterized protein FIBRA_02243 [Fibroporia radiculosa]CCM00215.1 predicted protein [Fibroporia radiculosa]
MARSVYSPSPSPSFDSDHFSDSSGIDDTTSYGEPAEFGSSISRPGSPGPSQPEQPVPEDDGEVDTMTCLWEECGKVFNHLPTLIEHIHNDHIECDKSFTRSDALAKHMRIQHNISPPLPGRGGNRKRKREEPDPSGHAPEPPSFGYSTFKVEPNTHIDMHMGDAEESRLSPMDLNGSGAAAAAQRPISPDYIEYDDTEDDIPPHLMARADPATGLICGRTHAMVKYLLMKAKHRWVLEQHEALVEELRVLRYEEKCWKERKDALMDELLRLHFGPQAEELTGPLVMAAQNHYVYPPDRDELYP